MLSLLVPTVHCTLVLSLDQPWRVAQVGFRQRRFDLFVRFNTLRALEETIDESPVHTRRARLKIRHPRGFCTCANGENEEGRRRLE